MIIHSLRTNNYTTFLKVIYLLGPVTLLKPCSWNKTGGVTPSLYLGPGGGNYDDWLWGPFWVLVLWHFGSCWAPNPSNSWMPRNVLLLWLIQVRIPQPSKSTARWRLPICRIMYHVKKHHTHVYYYVHSVVYIYILYHGWFGYYNHPNSIHLS